MSTVYDCLSIEIAVNYINPVAPDYLGTASGTVADHWDVTLANGKRIRFRQDKVHDMQGNLTLDDIVHSIVGVSPITSITTRNVDGTETTFTTDSA